MWDLEVNYDTRRFGKLTLGVENLANKYYILAFNQVDSFQNFFAGRGRVVSITDKFSF